MYTVWLMLHVLLPVLSEYMYVHCLVNVTYFLASTCVIIMINVFCLPLSLWFKGNANDPIRYYVTIVTAKIVQNRNNTQ